MPAEQLPRRLRRTLAGAAALATAAMLAGPAAPGYADPAPAGPRAHPASAPARAGSPKAGFKKAGSPKAGSQNAGSPKAGPQKAAAGRHQAGRPKAGPGQRAAGRDQAQAAGRAVKHVSYAGYRFTVPESWPVVSLARHPQTCVRFDRHAVYLGRTSTDQDCPSTVIGATEALQVAPGPRTARRQSSEDPVAQQITVTAPRISVTATFGDDATALDLILASAGLPAPVIHNPHPARLPAPGIPGALQHAPDTRAPAAGNPKAPTGRSLPNIARFAPVSPPALPANVANWRGRGFDTCAAPSAGTMRAWMRHSPFRAIGIYIGGSERACAQRNLSTRWLRAQARDGWRFFPLYVGPQAEFHQLRHPARQARRAASDAAAQAERLGFGPRTPIYYDMEAFAPGQAKRTLRFFSAWSRRLHYVGYESGVYSSSASGIQQLARHYRSRGFTRPDVVYDALWNGDRNTRDSVLRRRQWAGRRLHQYAGSVTLKYGGHRLSIDKDFLNVFLPTPGGSGQSSRTAVQPDGRVDVFYRGSGQLKSITISSGGKRSAPARLAGRFAGQPAAVTPVPGATDVFIQGTDNRLYELTRPPGGHWSVPRAITRMGQIGTPPTAVAQPNGVVDVFWKGSADSHLWHAQFSPGRGWRGPQKLGGSLASAPAPAESTPGTVQVFWKGTDRALWHVVRRPGGNWTRPSSLGMGPLGGAPHASGASNGTIGVFWHGAGNDELWGTTFRATGRWQGPLQLGGNLKSPPAPVLAPDGSAHVVWEGPDGQLWQALRGPAGKWHRAFPVGIPAVRGLPSVAVGASGKLAVFWRGSHGHLWFAAASGGTRFGAPRDLGGPSA